ncbi:MAG: serine protease [Candidatus Aminicenantes bacterium RBG_16_63_16]|nr:MAG: serine protease [Candidatus Aminicenantes bacterium RBG_16_63_16]
MKRILIVWALAAGLSAPLSGSVLKITVAAPIHPITAEYITRALDRASSAGDRLVIMALDTPGGLDSSMREIITALVNSKVPVVSYVSPSGARAASAGFFIGIASDLFVMAPGTSTGAAHPVGVSITGQGMDKTMEEKVTEDAVSYIKALAEKRGRNVVAAEDAVRRSASYTDKEALEKGLVNLVAKNDQEIIDAFDNRTITRFSGESLVLRLKGEPVVDYPMSARQKFLLTIANPNLAYILLMIGLLGLYFEFAHPGAILPGVLGGISLLLAIFAFQILPINYVGLLLILLSIGLFVLEVKVQSFGILAAGGVAAMVIGSLMLINSPVPELRPSLRVIIPVALGLSLIFVLLVYLVIKAHARKAVTGKEGLIGEVGVARTDLDPEGKVFVHGELWNAEAGTMISKGSRVRVVKALDTLKIRVEKI